MSKTLRPRGGATRGEAPEGGGGKGAKAGAISSELLEAAPYAILGVDGEGRVRLANAQAQKMFGYPRGEMEGKHVEALMPDRFRVQHEGHRNGFFESPRPRPMGAGLELVGRRKDGSEFPVDVSLTSVETGRGRLAAAFIRDITDRKRQEDQLRLANTDLESFSHTISHDLRTPLRSMRGFSRALIEDYTDRLDATGVDYLRRIDRAGASMERLIDDLLEYSRIGRREVQTRRVPLEAAIADVLRPLAQEVALTRATVEVVRPLHEVEAEPQLLGQALANFITNALKYVPRGVAPVVRLSSEERGEWVRITVEDHGLGISAEHFAQIWKPFERLHPKGEYPGTGVGLAIVQRAVERMGGRVGVESEPGSGSRFWIELRSPRAGAP